MHHLTRTGWLPALLVLATGTAAQVPDSVRADSGAQRLRTVTVTETRAASVSGGASAVVLSIPELRTSPAPLLHEALRESPFVHVRQNSRGEMELSVRGSDARQAAVMVDGVPITLGWDHRTDPSLVPITGSQRLTVVPGLGSLLNGPNTLGGTVEVNHDDALARTAQTWGGLGIDENGATVATMGASRFLAAGSGRGGFFVRGGLAHRQRDGVAVPASALDPTERDGLRTNSDLREVDGFASLRWSNGAGRAIGATVSAFDAERGVPPEEHIAAPRLWRYPYHRRSIVALSATSGAFQTPLGYAGLELGAGLNRGKLKIETYDDRDYDTVTGQELGDERTATLRAKLTQSLGTGGSSLRLAWTSSTVQYTETLGAAAGVDYEQRLTSVGAEVETPLGERTTLATGVVYDRSVSPLSGGREPKQEPFDNTGWRAGLTHALGDGWGLHASASQRSRFPALRELYSGALNRFQPNPALKPETLLGFEAGVTMQQVTASGIGVTMRLNGFRNTLDDAIVRVTVPNPAPPPVTLFRRVNRDQIRSTGIEALFGLTLGGGGDRAVTLTGDARLQQIAIVDRTANNAERHAENNPETRGSVELGVPLPWQLRGVATARYTGTQYCLNSDTGNEMTLTGRAVTDLAVERKVSVTSGPFRSLRAVLALDNVADATIYDQCGLPQPGRTLRVLFSFR